MGIEGDSDTGAGNHPYHQHVNPFQVVLLMGAGLDEYLGIRVGEYRDTIPLTPTSQYRIRFIPDRFDGRALVHCHMVPHIDLGMAAVVSINKQRMVVVVVRGRGCWHCRRICLFIIPNNFYE